MHALSCSKELTLVQSNTNTAECIEGSNALARSVNDAACDVREKGSSDGQCSRSDVRDKEAAMGNEAVDELRT